MKLLAVAVVALFAATAGIVAHGWMRAPELVTSTAPTLLAGSANLDLCKRIVADADAGSAGSAEETFGRYADEGLDTCRTLIDLHELE